jgi:MFS family permease
MQKRTTVVGELAESKAALYCQYGLISGQHMLTLVTRIGLPYFVAFLSVEAGLTDQQRSTLLSSFTAGYVTMQIPGGYLAQSIGNKAVCLINNLSVAALLSVLPLIARAGVPGLAPALALVGVLQGPLMISTGSLSTFWLPPPSSTDRPWAMLAVRMGSHMSKIVGPALTPWLIGRAGWRAAARMYGCAFALYALLWSTFARERPQALVDKSSGHTTVANHDMPKPTRSSPPPFTMWLLTVRPQMAIMSSQVCHDLLEFQTLASYAPVYFAEVLGVPLRRVGIYTVWPMVFGMAGKVGVTIFETTLLQRVWAAYQFSP